MLKVDSETSLSLHTLSHILQSLLMRVQADLYVAEKLGEEQKNQKSQKLSDEQDGQYFERCRMSVMQVSGLLENLFELLYYTSEPYQYLTQEFLVDEWWKKVEFELKKIMPTVIVKQKIGSEKVVTDFKMLEWALMSCLRAIGQWQKPRTETAVELFMISEREYEFRFQFVPFFSGGEGDPIDPKNEAFSLGGFYWACVLKAQELMGLGVTPMFPAFSGNVVIVWQDKNKPV